jgi:hypothetical protein
MQAKTMMVGDAVVSRTTIWDAVATCAVDLVIEVEEHSIITPQWEVSRLVE